MRPLKPLVLSIAAALLALVPAPMPAQKSPATTVILVRHAEKADEPGADPALSAAGEVRASALADALRGTKVSAVLTTPYKRTNATAAPLAAVNGLSPIVVPVSGGVPAYANAVADMIRRQYAGRVVVVVGHSNTIGSVIAALGGPKVNELCDNEYSTMYRLTLDGSATPRLVTSHYGASDAPNAAGCRAMTMPMSAPAAPGVADSAAVRRAVLDYVEGFYDGLPAAARQVRGAVDGGGGWLAVGEAVTCNCSDEYSVLGTRY